MNRRHDLDALRVIAFALLIAYHCGMLYVADWGWHLKSTHTYEWLQWPMVAMNRWRMDLIFLLSGLAIGLFQPERQPGRFALLRTWRLLLPLVFGMAAIVPVQAYCQGVANGVVEPGFGAFMARYLQLQPWPEGGFDGAEYGFTWNHLWYLAYLWTYTMLLALLLPVLRSGPVQRFAGWLGGLRGPWLVLLPAAVLALYMNTLLQPFGDAERDLVSDWYRHAEYFTVFLLGYLLARSRAFWTELLRIRTPLALAALALGAIYVPLLMADIGFGDFALAAMRCLRALYAWTMLLAILAWGHHLLNRPFRWLPYATEAVYPWYILHQSATVLLAYWLVPLGLPVAVEAVAVVLGTVATCALGHELVRRVGPLRPLFGLKRRQRPEPAPVGTLEVVGGRENIRTGEAVSRS